MESAPEILDEPIAPEAATTVDEVSETAPEEEKEEEPKERVLDKRLNQEESDPALLPEKRSLRSRQPRSPLRRGPRRWAARPSNRTTRVTRSRSSPSSRI